MNDQTTSWPASNGYGRATWTDLARIRQYQHLIRQGHTRLRALLANPLPNLTEIATEKMTINEYQRELQRLERKFELRPEGHESFASHGSEELANNLSRQTRG